MSTAQACDQGTGRRKSDTGELHELPAALVLFGGLGNGFVLLVNAFVEPISVYEQVADTAVGPARQCFDVGADFPAHAFDFLWQDNVEFADQATQAVIERRTFFDEALPGAVQAEDGLLVDILHRDEAHVVPGDVFADGGHIGGVVLAALAAHPVERHELGVISLTVWAKRPNSLAQ